MPPDVAASNSFFSPTQAFPSPQATSGLPPVACLSDSPLPPPAGYEWNKYNQTHYDYDNPPPKVVQGYKFNILYHDLIDKQVAPSYKVERDPESADDSTCMLRFTAGPPYEDIAFRWE